MRRRLIILRALAGMISLLLCTTASAQQPFCDKTANLVHRACMFESKDDWRLAKAICLNLSDGEQRAECYGDALEGRDEGFEACGDQFDARLELCEALGQDRYEPDWSPENFVDPRDIGVTVDPNPYLPMIEGMVRIYEKDFEEDGEMVHEVITVVITDEIKHVNGVDCRTVSDVVMVDGELIEDTDDWFAQDIAGNVWYCGEEVKDYEYFDGDEPSIPELVATDGSFKAGRDGDLPGLLALADPQVGDIYREEVSYNNAEDASEIISITASATVPGASCDGTCVVTRAFSPLEPGVEEEKYYAPGIGPILELDEEGNRTELVEVMMP